MTWSFLNKCRMTVQLRTSPKLIVVEMPLSKNSENPVFMIKTLRGLVILKENIYRSVAVVLKVIVFDLDVAGDTGAVKGTVAVFVF